MANHRLDRRNTLLTVLVIALILFFGNPATAATITVGPSDCNYTSIQDAIDHASAGDTILVTGGTYAEAIDVNKTLTLRGVNGTPAVGKMEEDASVRISADDIILENFRITTGARWDVWVGGNNLFLCDLNMSGHNPGEPADPVITAKNVSGLSIEGCTLDTSGTGGIMTENVPDFVLCDSHIRIRNEEKQTVGIGCMAEYNQTTSSGPVVTNTTVVGGMIRIICPDSEVHGITLLQNTVTDTDSAGILVIGMPVDEKPLLTTNVTIVGNRVSDSNSLRANIMVQYCRNGRIEDNLVENSYVGADGIYLQNLDNFLIQGNTVRDSTVDTMRGMAAINLEVIVNSTISGNTVTNVTPYAFWYAPGPDFHPNLTFDATNTADGRPVRYYEGADGLSLVDEDLAMLIMLSSSDMQVTGCTIANAGLGAGVYGCSNLSIRGNIFRETNNGMMLIRSSHTAIRENTFNNSFFGMGVGDNTDTLIAANTFSGYIDSGMVIHCGNSDEVMISENRFDGSLIGTDQGVAATDAYGRGVALVNNTFTGNSRGILLGIADELTFRDNHLTNNGVGVNMLGASRNVFLNNTIANREEDYVGILIHNAEVPGGGPCVDNLFSNNYIESDEPLIVTYLNPSLGIPYEYGPLWGPNVTLPAAVPSSGNFHNDWNITKTGGINIVGGPSLGGNYWATPDGTGWSQVTPDRGDGFCTEPFAYDGNNTDYLPLHLYVDPTPVANFTLSPVTGYAPLKVAFTDISTGNITNWSWSFGDGTTSDLQNPEHTYPAVGIYSVTLNVTGPAGQSELTRPNVIRVWYPGGSGGGSGNSAPKVMTGTGSLKTNSDGLVLRDTLVSAGDDTGILAVLLGSVALDGNGDPLRDVTISPSPLPSDRPAGTFSFAGYAYSCGPDGATFSPAADLIFSFTEAGWANLMAEGRPLVVMYYNEATGAYEEVPMTVNAATRTVTAKVTHFSSFVLMYGAVAEETTPVATAAPTSPTTTVAQTTGTPTSGQATPFPVMGGLLAVLVFAVCVFVGRQQ